MPESRKRKPKKPNRARQRAAQLDGEQVQATGGCCAGMTVEIAVGSVNVRHDRGCASLTPSSPDHIPARAQSNRVVNYVLQERGLGRPVTVMIR